MGIVTNLTPAYCRDPENGKDQKAARIADLMFNRSFLDPSVKGVYPRELVDILKENSVLPSVMPGDTELIRENTVDFVGVNYYHPRRVCHREMPLVSDVFMPDQYSENYMPENCKMNRSRGWEIYEMASQGHKGRLQLFWIPYVVSF
ncbi:family 1 glycosylhydrolase [Enterocloster citroniae]|nr:family 1 glycosylhydrolase [Enterocloster citroniae]